MRANTHCVFGEGVFREGNFFVHRNQLFPSRTRLMMCRLRAVTAILRTPASLRAVKKAFLNVLDIVVFTMSAMCLVKQIEEGLAVESEGSRPVRLGGHVDVVHLISKSRERGLRNEGFILS